jgi:hypothetical protein
MLTVKTARALLPKIGDYRWEHPTIDETSGAHSVRKPQRCVVVEVNAEHLWYTVQFENGIRESYKMPKVKLTSGGALV